MIPGDIGKEVIRRLAVTQRDVDSPGGMLIVDLHEVRREAASSQFLQHSLPQLVGPHTTGDNASAAARRAKLMRVIRHVQRRSAEDGSIGKDVEQRLAQSDNRKCSAHVRGVLKPQGDVEQEAYFFGVSAAFFFDKLFVYDSNDSRYSGGGGRRTGPMPSPVCLSLFVSSRR